MAEFCNEPGCTGLALTGKFCPAHVDNNYLKNRVRPERDEWYQHRMWRGRYGVRLFKLRRDPMCEECKIAPAEDVHHKDDSWKETGNWHLFLGGVNMENLVSLCHRCHSAITMKRNQERGVLCQPSKIA